MGGDDMTVNVNYLDVPLNLKFSTDMSGTTVYGIVGPYIGVAISGKQKFDGDSVDLDIGSDEDEDDVTRLDFGLSIGAGAEFGAISVGATYGLGLANISPYTDNGTKGKNRVFAISIGYKFGGGE